MSLFISINIIFTYFLIHINFLYYLKPLLDSVSKQMSLTHLDGDRKLYAFTLPYFFFPHYLKTDALLGY